MQTHIGHIQFNIQSANLAFYRELMSFLGWQSIYDGEGGLGVAGQHGTSLWFMAVGKDVINDYDGPGMNHFAFGTATQADVDATVAFLTQHGVAQLFETPRHRPEFSESEEHTYYQVMFESPDHILFEVVYTGPKAA